MTTRLLYNILLSLAMVLMLPHYLLKMRKRGGYRANFANRFGIYSKEQRDGFGAGGAILVHAVSVGEVGVAFQLMETMRSLDPALSFVISTTSSTGWMEAQKRLSKGDVLVYNPIDLPLFVSRALKAIRPSAFVIVETEIWPNIIHKAKALSIPVAIVNGRISDKTASFYKKFSFLFRPSLRLVDSIMAQSPLDRDRFVSAGARPERVAVTGSYKFDGAKQNFAKEEMWRDFLGKLDLLGEKQILLGASTWDGEEKLLLDVYTKLLQKNGNLRLVLVPRHFERRGQIESLVQSYRLESHRKSDLDSGAERPFRFGENDVLLGDTTGELMGLYPFSAITVVGRTFFSFGGQNMLEPCLAGVPTVVGPHTQNFRPVMEVLEREGALVRLESAGELECAVEDLLSNPEKRENLSAKAVRAVESGKGCVLASAKKIISLMR